MTTIKVNEVVVDALEYIITQAEEAPIEATEGRAAMRALNDMMTMWAAKGVELGFTVVSDLGDPVTVAPGAMMGIKTNLALALAPKYLESVVSQDLKDLAKAGYQACVDLAVDMGASEYPSTLPQGSGNDYPSYATETFYPDQEDTILTETGGSIALEDDTEEA